MGRSNLGDILKDIYEQRAPSGPNAELQRHHGLGSNQIPLTLLRDPDNDVETRAITPAPGDHQTNQRPIVPAVYAMGDVAFLMIPQEVVAAGDAVFPIVVTRPTVGGPVTDVTSVAETVGSFS